MFLAYDQLNPDDSFGHRMQSSLSSKHSPLLGIHLYSDGWYLSERARKAGLTDVRFANFYDISSYFICDDEKNRVDKLEAFDEFEEWSEMCEHYGILYGRSPSYDSERYGVLGDVEVLKVIDKPIKKRVKKREEESGVVTSLCPHMFIGHHAWPSSRFSKEGFGNGGFHAEYIRLPGEHNSDGAGSSYQAVLVGFGGISTKKGTTRDDTLTVHAIGYSMGNLNVIETGTKPCARAYHSFTRVSPWKYVVFGGRTNPNDILSDTFLLELGIDEDTLTVVGKWSRLVCSSSDAPCARYRHLAVGCFGVKDVKRHSGSLHHCPAVLFIQGGRTLSDEDSMNANEIKGCHIKDDLNQDKIKRKNTSIFTPNRLSDMWLGSVDTVSKTISWERPDVHCEPDHQLPPLCSASAVRLDGNTDESCCKVLITGGLLHDFYPSNSAWEVNITNCWGERNVSNEKEDGGKQLKRATVTVNKMKWTLGKHGRFSHTMTLLPDQETILVLGGSGFVPKGNADNFPPYIISKGGVVKPVNLPDSLSKVTLTLHSVTLIHPFPHLTVGDDSSSQPVVLAVIGGGFMCFSFGQYTVTPFLLKLSTLSLTCAQEPVIFPNSNRVNSNSNGDDNNDVTSVVYDSRHYPDTHLHKENKKSIIGLIPIKPRNPFPNKYTIDSYSAEAWHSTLVKSNNTSEPIILSGPLHPYLFRKVPVGKCVDSWNTENVRQHFESDDRGKTRIAVHVAKGSASLDFINKNFEFRHVTLAEMVQHCFPPTQVNHEGNHVDTMPAKTLKETWYFRSVGSNMKTERSNFFKDFPLLADEFHLPEEIKDLVLNPAYHHQSCLRINEGGMQLWTHYDIMDNILVNITGRKRVVLFHPSQANNLYVPTGSSSSPIIDIDNLSPKLIRQYPNYIGAHHHHSTMEVVLGPGDMLVIPALWFHHITAIDPCISINIFYKRPSMCVPREGEEALVSSSLKGLGSGAVCCSDSKMASATQQNDRNSLYDPKDLYGNKDLPSLVEIREQLLNIINKSSSASAHPCLSPPLEFRAFMLQQLANEVNALSQKLYLEASSSISETSNNGK